jgi:regulator of sirC expression with transglutaminase-like and TPR domain
MLHSSAIAVDFRRPAKSDEPARPQGATDVVRSILSLPDGELDYARAKVTFDSVIDPSVDVEATLSLLDDLAETVRELVAGAQTVDAKLNALRKVLHEAGPWNDHRPFAYDQSDPLGRRMQNKLLHNYLATRLGQCVSMPALFLILAERLGLDASLALAPEHVFVRVLNQGRPINLETTSGAHPARDAWYRQKFPITDRSMETGVYLRSLSKREGIAVMACNVAEHLYKQGRFNAVTGVCNLILASHPTDVQTLVCLGSAYGKMLTEFQQQYPIPFSAPPKTHAHAVKLMHQNMRLFEMAENLGWVPFDEGRRNVR